MLLTITAESFHLYDTNVQHELYAQYLLDSGRISEFSPSGFQSFVSGLQDNPFSVEVYLLSELPVATQLKVHIDDAVANGDDISFDGLQALIDYNSTYMGPAYLKTGTFVLL